MSRGARLHILLITGRPGVGKTTAIKALARSLRDRPDDAGRRRGRLEISGFYTEEIRVRGERRGFRAVTFDGWERDIARVGQPEPRVGKYGVDVDAIDLLASRALSEAPDVDVYLVDEIGKMECLSDVFVRAMRHLLDVPAPIVATIAERGTGFIAEVKTRAGAEIWTMTRTNRDDVAERARQWIEAHAPSR